MALAVAMLFGVWLGRGMLPESAGGSHQKLLQMLQYVENEYVDSVGADALEAEVIAYLLQRLDPHSYYIDPENLASMNEPLEGGFEGIGIHFSLRGDSIYVVNTIAGGPAEQAGLMAGDRIVSVNGQQLSMPTNSEVTALLKGPTGTEVNVSVARKSASALLSFTVARGSVALESIEAAYLLNDTTVAVKLARFSKTTMEEFKTRVYPLQHAGIKHFVLDLRGNGGGYLDAAISLADEFLGEGQLITYTEGKARPREDFFATNVGRFEQQRLSVLIDSYTASASEIFAGAMQDHRRATIIGHRSFGKALVQEQNEWADGSATRLTVARYFTPLGRSIQRPYVPFQPSDAYYFDQPDTAVGGIVPDVEVAQDTSAFAWFFADLMRSGLMLDFVYHHRDANANQLSAFTGDGFVESFDAQTLPQSCFDYMKSKGFETDMKVKAAWHPLLALRLKAALGRSLFGDEVYFRLLYTTDPVVAAAL